MKMQAPMLERREFVRRLLIERGNLLVVSGLGSATWDVAAASPVTAVDVTVASPVAAGELAVGFFGSRYERATPAEREYLRALGLPDIAGE